MTTTKKKQPKALWYRAKHGDKPTAKPRRRIKPISKRRAKASREYAHEVAKWKRGKLCAVMNMMHGGVICEMGIHGADDCHHTRGRVGALLLDKRFWMPVCRKAHRFIQEHPTAARNLGLLAPIGQWNTMPKEAA